MNKSGYKQNNKVQLINGGAAYFEKLKKLIDQSIECIHIKVYIFENDQTGSEIAESLIKASKRNVSVYLMVDGIASKNLSKNFIGKLIDSGIRFCYFNPLLNFKEFLPGRRMHQKVITIDNSIALVGGINIADKYNDTSKGRAWLDFAVLIYGDVANDLGNYCRKFWDNNKSSATKTIETKNKIREDEAEGHNCEVRIRVNDWIFHKNEISNSYIEMFLSAKKEITILCSYFIPGKVFRRLIKNASRRGIRITVITAGISDLLISKNAERWLYDWLLRHRVHLYEYQNNILHGKIAVCDASWLTIGSYNINDISAYASIELNLDVKSEAFASETIQKINQIINEGCIKITTEIHTYRKNMLKQFNRWASYQFIRFIFVLFTFYFKRKD